VPLRGDEGETDDSHDGSVVYFIKVEVELVQDLKPDLLWQFVSFNIILLVVDYVFEHFHDLEIVHFTDQQLEVLDAEGVDVLVEGGREGVLD
jgi:hypothetical protein